MVLSRIDYAISTLSGIDKKQIQRLQRVQNAAARMVCKLTRLESVNNALSDLGWLPVHARIRQRVAILVHKVVSGNAAPYLCELIHPYVSERSLRSTDCRLLEVPRTRTLIGDRTFAVSGPTTWNSLPVSVRESDKLSSFESELTKHLFISL